MSHLIKELLKELKTVGERLDDYLSNPKNMAVTPVYGDDKRNADQPILIRQSNEWEENAASQGWYITPEKLQQDGPAEFTTLDGKKVVKGSDGYRNPNGQTGLTGPGILGFFKTPDGPIPESRAVDVVIQFIDNDGKLKILGGVRGDTGRPCFIGGFTEAGALKTAVKEFIEEAISGSLIKNKDIPADLIAVCKTICEQRGGKHTYDADELTSDQKEALKAYGIDAKSFSGDLGEAVYSFIAKEDPRLIEELTTYFKSKLDIAYKGPVRADPRNTDQRWIATEMLTGLVDKKEIEGILKKPDRKFAYDFIAGSDMAETAFHEFSPIFLRNAYASHGPLACYATAHNLRKAVQKGIEIPTAIWKQVSDTLDNVTLFLDRKIHEGSWVETSTHGQRASHSLG